MSSAHPDHHPHDHSHKHSHARQHHNESTQHDNHGHSHAPKDFDNAFFIGKVLNAGFVAAEVVYAIGNNSLALLADAGHNLSDNRTSPCAGRERAFEARANKTVHLRISEYIDSCGTRQRRAVTCRDWRDCMGSHHALSPSN